MPNPYVQLLGVPGGPAFSAAGFVARLPISMVGIGLVLLVSAATGRYGLAGAVTATYALAGAVLQPLVSRAADRRGQSAVVAATTSVSLAGLVALVGLTTGGAPAWTFFPAAAVAGGLSPNVGSMVRARWSARLAGTPALRTAYSWESVLDEVVFVVGPPFITLLAARAGAAQALLATQAFLVVGTVWFVALRRSEPPRAVGGHLGGPSLLGLPGLRALAVVMVALGGAFGSVEVITVAFADELDRPLVAGAVLGLYAASSLVGGVVYGARATVVPLHRQLVRLGCLLPLPMLPLPLADRPVVLALLVTASGLLVAPTLIATFALVDQLVPAERLTEGLTWAMTGITFGISVGAAVSGPLVDAVGTPSAFAVTAACGLLTAGAVVGGARWLHPVRGPGPACGPPSAGAGRR